MRIKGRDGVYRWFLSRAVPARNPDGSVRKWFGTLSDIHAQKEALEDAHRVNQQAQTVLSNFSGVLWAADPEGNILIVQGQGLEAVGITPESMRGQNIYEFSKGRGVLEEMQAALRGENRSYASQFRGRALETRISPLRDSGGKIVGFVGVSFDVTERQAAQRERLELVARERSAQESARLKTEFLANMSHELRTPIHGVLGMAELLADSQLSIDQREWLSSMRASARHLLSIVNDILDHTRIEAGRLDIASEAFELDQLLGRLERPHRLLAESKGLIFELHRDPALASPRLGDSVRVTQVLTNLLGNAVKFTDAGSIQFRVLPVAGHAERVRFEVRDTGSGITAEVLPSLFKPFTQADASTARRFGGSGLGLAISQSLVERMGGTLGVESEPGRGSSFWCELPLPESRSVIASPERGNVHAPAALPSSAKVFAAEDNEINLRILLATLKRLGVQATGGPDGAAAVAAMAEGEVDLIFMDCHMPGVDGYTATRRIRESETGGRRVPIIALTADAMPGTRQLCLDAGMVDYLPKPFSSAQIERVLERWLAPEGRPPRTDSGLASVEERLRRLAEAAPETPDFVRQLVTLFQGSVLGKVADLRAGVAEQDGPRIRDLAHELKGSAANLGLSSLARIFAEFEMTAEESAFARLPTLLGNLDRELPGALATLAAACPNSFKAA